MNRQRIVLLPGISTIRFWTSGWSKRGVGPDVLCERHGQAWMDGRWFTRWCRDCRKAAR